MDRVNTRASSRFVAVCVAAGLLLTVTVGVTGAGAHPGNNGHERNRGMDVQVDPPVELAERLSNVPCEDGQAAVFTCDGIDLLAFVPHAEFAGGTDIRQLLGGGVSDLWGWTDPDTGDEYVIIGKTNGVGFFRVSDPTNPVYLGELPNQALLHQTWHDIKVYDNHAFIVSESFPHGMTVFDLTRLRGVQDVRTWSRDGFYPLAASAHNLEINTDTGFAYIVGGNAALVLPDLCLSGLHMVDISTPTSPTFAGCYSEEGGPGTLSRTLGEPLDELLPLSGYVHDTQCVIYDGPDERYSGREVCFNSAENKVVIADVTDKHNPVTLGMTDYPMMGYTHQGWLTEDHAYLLVNDELDETTFGINTRTVVLDVTDLENPTLHVEHSHETRSITHNNYVVGDFVYQSNYTSGLRVLDTTGLYGDDPGLEEVGFFDTFPTHDDPTFDGTWSNYPFFASGTIAVSGIGEGLFLLRLRDEAIQQEDGPVAVSCTNCPLQIRAGESETAQISVRTPGDEPSGAGPPEGGGNPEQDSEQTVSQQGGEDAGVVTATATGLSSPASTSSSEAPAVSVALVLLILTATVTMNRYLALRRP